MKINSFKDLTVWQKSMDLVVLIYKNCQKLPKEETYGLISQIKRCAVSIPSNIAEGKRRDSINEYIRFLNIAFSSGAELETQLEITKRVDYLSIDELKEANLLLTEVMKMLNILIRKLRKYKT